MQHPNIIDESLKKAIEAGHILGPFLIPLLYPTFSAQAWVPYQNMMGAGGSSITFQLLQALVLMILLILMIALSLTALLMMHTPLLIN